MANPPNAPDLMAGAGTVPHGKVSELVIDNKSGRIAYAVISSGGVLGMGERLIALPFEALTLRPGEKAFVIDADKDRLSQASGFSSDNWPSISSALQSTVGLSPTGLSSAEMQEQQKQRRSQQQRAQQQEQQNPRSTQSERQQQEEQQSQQPQRAMGREQDSGTKWRSHVPGRRRRRHRLTR